MIVDLYFIFKLIRIGAYILAVIIINILIAIKGKK